MAHEIDMSNDRQNIAFVGQRPWHGLGQELTPNAPLEVWCKEAGLDWSADERDVLYMHDSEHGDLLEVPDKKVLVRSDTLAPLSVVSRSFRVVQPGEVLEFYRSLVENMGFELETAGSIKGGRRVWALARTGEEMSVMGQDRINGYVLCATAFDGTMATVVSRTSVRVVCWNTLTFAVGAGGEYADVRIPHIAKFNPDIIKGRLGLENNDAWTAYQDHVQALAERKVSQEEAVQFFLDVLYGEGQDVDAHNKNVQRTVAKYLELYSVGVGQQTRSASGTAWGLVNAVTRFVDHERGTRTVDARLNRAWFGDGRRSKQKAFDTAMKLVA